MQEWGTQGFKEPRLSRPLPPEASTHRHGILYGLCLGLDNIQALHRVLCPASQPHAFVQHVWSCASKPICVSDSDCYVIMQGFEAYPERHGTCRWSS